MGSKRYHFYDSKGFDLCVRVVEEDCVEKLIKQGKLRRRGDDLILLVMYTDIFGPELEAFAKDDSYHLDGRVEEMMTDEVEHGLFDTQDPCEAVEDNITDDEFTELLKDNNDSYPEETIYDDDPFVD